MYGSPETNAGGGRSLEYYLGVDLRCSVKKSDGDLLKDTNGNLEGIKGKVKNTKNKCAIPFQECEFKLFFDEGLDPHYGLTKVLEMDKTKALYWETKGEVLQKLGWDDEAKECFARENEIKTKDY